MQPITQASEYAIRALTYLAQRHGDGYQLGREIASDLGVPAPYLSKILVSLVGRDILESQRGRGGGFRLTVDPDTVTLYDVVDSQEDLGRARRCILGQDECSDERACPMHEYWKVASANWQERLRSTTLADVVTFCEKRPASRYPGTA